MHYIVPSEIITQNPKMAKFIAAKKANKAKEAKRFEGTRFGTKSEAR
jgi:hypothetical protein